MVPNVVVRRRTVADRDARGNARKRIVLCCERTTSYCGSNFVVLWVGNLPGNGRQHSSEDETKFRQQHFDLRKCIPKGP
jgi:hypothetical protein